MIKELKKQGLLDENGQLTQKGHEYVGEVKRKYDQKTSKNRKKLEKTDDQT